MCVCVFFFCGKEGGGVLTKEKKHVKRQKRDENILSDEIFHLFAFFLIFVAVVCRRHFFFLRLYDYYENKNARNATHLHDLLGIPDDDDFEEKSFGEQQRDEADSF